MTRSLIAAGGTRMIFADPMSMSPAVITRAQMLGDLPGRTRSHRLGLVG